ncbi:MAG: hypothetical protein HYR96_08310 [Deltaproteobacteria bacterium]|nr:hypothetical protein [Deltaproteobacteria bacterium]MBI3294967.1 hypothetical protein [Deltaproteobacteria bacterium]
MKDELFSPEMRRFIAHNIDSVATLEILALLYGVRDKEMSVERITTELRSSGPAVNVRAQQLTKQGILKTGTSPLSYRYQPNSEALHRLVEELTKLYSRYHVRVIDQIYNPGRSAAQELADAFRIKSGDDDNG